MTGRVTKRRPSTKPSTRDSQAPRDRLDGGHQMDEYLFPRAAGVIQGKDSVPGEFAKALRALASDARYRDAATSEPSMVPRDFKLTVRELKSLREAAILSGADVTAINRLRVGEMAAHINVSEVDNGCCCCCCCCCGETAALVLRS